MERIGDQASDIVELDQYIKKSDVKYKTHLSDMANEVIKMVTKSIKSFVKKDIEMARNVIVYDDVVDNYFEEIKTVSYTHLDVYKRQPLCSTEILQTTT